MDSVNIAELHSDRFKEFLSSFDHVFSDCDGVIWDKSPLPDSGIIFELMKKLGKTVHFVSNNSTRSKKEYESMFKAAGIENGYENLTIPSIVIAQYLKSISFKKKIYCVTCPETIKVLELHGFRCEDGPEIGNILDAEKYLTDDEEIGAVLFDSDFNINLSKMYRAITYLKRPDVLFTVGAANKYICLKPGTSSLGLGYFIDIVSKETNRQPILFGKPSKQFGKFAIQRAGVTDPSRVLLIGDTIEQDLKLGEVLGFKTLLILTNVFVKKMITPQMVRPKYYAESLSSIVPLLRKCIENSFLWTKLEKL